MKIAELRQKTPEDLKQMLSDNRKKLTTLNFDLAAGKVKNIKELRQTKHEIARILTLLREPEIKK